MKARGVLSWRSSSLSIHCMEQHHTASNWLHSHWFGRGVVRCVCLDGALVSRPVCIGFDSVDHLFLHRFVGWMGRNAFPRGTFRFVPIKDVGLCRYVSWVVVCVFHLGRTTTSFLPCTMVHPSIHASFLRSKVIHVVPTLHLGLGGWEPTHPSVPPHTHTPHPLPWIPPPCGISFHPGEYLLSLSLCVCVCLCSCVGEREREKDHSKRTVPRRPPPRVRPWPSSSFLPTTKGTIQRTKDEGAWTACRMEAWNDLSGSTSGRT